MVLQKMHEYLFTVFQRDVLEQWDDIQDAKKKYLIELLESDFLQPPHLQFHVSQMLKKGAKVMHNRHLELNDRVREGKGRPTWCNENLWERLAEKMMTSLDLGSQQ